MADIPSIDRVAVDPAKIAGFTSEGEFVELSFNLLREVASYVCVAACMLGPEPTWNRGQAAVGGNMVRLFKLLSALLDQTMQDRAETITILSRLAFETVVNARYLVAYFTPELVDSYIRRSLRHERRLWDRIRANIAGRGGEVLPIEQRMLNSIERAARIAEITLDSIDLKDRSPWGGKNLREKAQAVDLDGGAYEAAFGGMSHNVHGAWHDIYQFHLETEGNGEFTPNLEWGRPRPQPLFALGIIALGAVHDFLRFIGGEAALSDLRDAIEDLNERLHTADQGHETYLAGKKWPEI